MPRTRSLVEIGYLSDKGEAVSTVITNHNLAPHSGVQADPTLPNWYAVYTACRHEKRVRQRLEFRGIESFLATYRVVPRWKNGVKTEIEIPLFPNYVFVKITPSERIQVLEVPSVVTIVSNGRELLPLSAADVEALRRGIHSRLRIEPFSDIAVGDRVRVVSGPLEGVIGTLVRRKSDTRLVVSLSTISQTFAAEVDSTWVERLEAQHSSSLSGTRFGKNYVR